MVRIATLVDFDENDVIMAFPGYSLQTIPLHLKLDIVLRKIFKANGIEKKIFIDNTDYY